MGSFKNVLKTDRTFGQRRGAGAPAVVVGALMITAPLLVGNLIGSSLDGFSGYNMFTGGNVPRDSNNNPLVNKEQKQGDDGKVK